MDFVNAVKVDDEKKRVLVKVNPRIFHLDVIYAAAYVLMGRAYVFIDGDPEKEIFIELKSKVDDDLEKLGSDFHEELINYSVYYSQLEKNKGIKLAILQKALLSDDLELKSEEDPLGIKKVMKDDKENKV